MEKKQHQKRRTSCWKRIGDEVHLSFGGLRRYRIRGMEKNHSSQQLKVNILAVRDELVHLDTLDLYKARSRTSFIKATASELYVDVDVIKRDMGAVLLQLEQLQHDRIEAATQTQQPPELSADRKTGGHETAAGSTAD